MSATERKTGEEGGVSTLRSKEEEKPGKEAKGGSLRGKRENGSVPQRLQGRGTEEEALGFDFCKAWGRGRPSQISRLREAAGNDSLGPATSTSLN